MDFENLKSRMAQSALVVGDAVQAFNQFDKMAESDDYVHSDGLNVKREHPDTVREAKAKGPPPPSLPPLPPSRHAPSNLMVDTKSDSTLRRLSGSSTSSSVASSHSGILSSTANTSFSTSVPVPPGATTTKSPLSSGPSTPLIMTPIPSGASTPVRSGAGPIHGAAGPVNKTNKKKPDRTTAENAGAVASDGGINEGKPPSSFLSSGNNAAKDTGGNPATSTSALQALQSMATDSSLNPSAEQEWSLLDTVLQPRLNTSMTALASTKSTTVTLDDEDPNRDGNISPKSQIEMNEYAVSSNQQLGETDNNNNPYMLSIVAALMNEDGSAKDKRFQNPYQCDDEDNNDDYNRWGNDPLSDFDVRMGLQFQHYDDEDQFHGNTNSRPYENDQEEWMQRNEDGAKQNKKNPNRFFDDLDRRVGGKGLDGFATSSPDITQWMNKQQYPDDARSHQNFQQPPQSAYEMSFLGSFAQSSDKFQWMKSVAAPKLQSMTMGIATQLKERAEEALSSDHKKPPLTRTRFDRSSFSRLGDDDDEDNYDDEGFSTKVVNSTQFLGDDEARELQRIRSHAMKRMNPLSPVMDLIRENPRFAFIVLTFLLTSLVYFYARRRTEDVT